MVEYEDLGHSASMEEIAAVEVWLRDKLPPGINQSDGDSDSQDSSENS